MKNNLKFLKFWYFFLIKKISQLPFEGSLDKNFLKMLLITCYLLIIRNYPFNSNYVMANQVCFWVALQFSANVRMPLNKFKNLSKPHYSIRVEIVIIVPII